MQESVYSPEAVAALRSPDDLEKTIRVINPRVYVILAACIALLLGLLAWGVFGTVDSGAQATGIVRDGKILCLLDDSETQNIRVGNRAAFEGGSAVVQSVAEIPVSKGEALEALDNEYLVSVNLDGEWGRLVTLLPEKENAAAEGSLISFYITTERVAPISLILGGSN